MTNSPSASSGSFVNQRLCLLFCLVKIMGFQHDVGHHQDSLRDCPEQFFALLAIVGMRLDIPAGP